MEGDNDVTTAFVCIYTRQAFSFKADDLAALSPGVYFDFNFPVDGRELGVEPRAASEIVI